MNLISKSKAMVLAFVFAMLAMSGTASATSTLGSTVSDAIEAAGPEVVLVIAAVAAVLVIIVAWKLIKSAMR